MVLAERPRRDPAYLEHASQVIHTITFELHQEVPEQIHTAEIEGSSRAFHPDFIAYIDRQCKDRKCHDPSCTHGQRSIHVDSRVRVSRALRRLRAEAPREFDVVNMVCRHHMTIEEVAERLNIRAVAGGHPERYTIDGTQVLLLSGIHKIELFW